MTLNTAKALEPLFDEIFEKESKLSSKEPPLTEVDLESVPPTAGPPSTTKSSTKDVKEAIENDTKDVTRPTKKVKNTKSTKPNKPKKTDTSANDSKPNREPISTPPPASKRVAKMTDVDHLVYLAHSISSVMGPRDTAEDDELLTLSSLKCENKIRKRRQE